MTKVEREAQQRLDALRRLSPESLIKRHVRRQRTIDAAKAEQAEIEIALGEKFPCEKAEEEIIKASGIAERKRSNSYAIIEPEIPNLREALGLDFSSIVEEKQTHEVPNDRMPALIEHLGEEVDQYVKTTKTYVLTKLASTRIGKGDESLIEKMAGGYAVTEKITVKVKPIPA
jgi:hypothetical protein